MTSVPIRPARFPVRWSVVVPVRNEAEALQSCLTALRFQTYPNYELLVVAYGGDGEVLTQVQLQLPAARRVRSEAASVHGALLAGAQLASGDVLALTVPAALAPPSWLADWTTAWLVEPLPAAGWGPVVTHTLDLEGDVLATQAEPLALPAPSLANAAVDPQALLAAGGLDPAIEDADLALAEVLQRIAGGGYPLAAGTAPVALRPTLGSTTARLEARSRVAGWWDGRQGADRRPALRPATGFLGLGGPGAGERALLEARARGYDAGWRLATGQR